MLEKKRKKGKKKKCSLLQVVTEGRGECAVLSLESTLPPAAQPLLQQRTEAPCGPARGMGT